MNLTHTLRHPATQQARALVRRMEEETLAEQVRIVAIAAPSLQEGERAAYVRQRLEDGGLRRSYLDAAGNVLAMVPDAVDADAPPVVVAAHLDTVFAADTDLTPRHVGDRVYAPGITDNARGLAALITLAGALQESGIRTRRPIWLVGTVGEEGNGNLRGVKHLFREGGDLAKPSSFIALDGSGIRRIVHRAIGARRLRLEFRGPGGHSWSDWGTANALHALGRAIESILRLPRPESSPVTLTVARAAGGTSVNAIPNLAWMELDIRSEEQQLIATLEGRCRAAVEEVLAEENGKRKRGTAPLTLEVRVIGDRPSGRVDESAPLVAAAMAATRAVGARPELVASSTDANVPLSLGIPAVTLGAGGESGGIHTTEEWFCNREGARGLERALLTVLTAAGVV